MIYSQGKEVAMEALWKRSLWKMDEPMAQKKRNTHLSIFSVALLASINRCDRGASCLAL